MNLLHSTPRRAALVMVVVALSALLSACSNFPSRQPPLYIWDDMKWQPKYKAQQQSKFFYDQRDSRRPVSGTVPQENFQPEQVLATGITASNEYVARNPEPLDKAVLLRGQQKFNVYCSPCHDRTGSGRGIVAARSSWVPGNLHDDRVVNMVDGEIFNVITMGRRSMPAYRFQINEKDRWAIVAYVRALQLSWRGTINEVPADMQAKLR
jgi:mono/diheme cytochrome c family protein